MRIHSEVTLYIQGVFLGMRTEAASQIVLFISTVALLSKRLQRNQALNEVGLQKGTDKHYSL